MHLKFSFFWVCVGATATATVTSAWAQSPSIDAGTLLEQQRRLDPPLPATAPRPGVLPVLPAQPLAPDQAGGTLTTVRAFRVEGATLLAPATLQAALKPWIDRPDSLADLRRAATAIEDLYRANGWLVRVSLPPQDITEGTVRLVVTESRLGRIIVQPGENPGRPGAVLAPALGARVEAMLRDRLPTGQPLSLTGLERALLLSNDIPGVRLSGSLQASDLADSTDLVVVLSPGAADRREVAMDNGGNRATGAARLNADLGLDSPLGLGERFGLRASASQGTQFVGLKATVPLPGSAGHQGWQAAMTTSALRYRVLDDRNTTTGLAPEGGSSSFGGGLEYPLVRTAVAHWRLATALAQTSLRNRDDNQTPGLLETTSRARTRALVLALYGSQFDDWAGGGANSAELGLSAGRLSLDGSPAGFIDGDAQTVATQGRFHKLRWSASRLQTLAPEQLSQLSLLVAASGQFASTNLDPSERFYLGGINGVRAYPNAEGGGSVGQLLSIDLRKQLDAQWQISAFYDRGQVLQYRRNRFPGTDTPLVATNRITLQGKGLAVTWRGRQGADIKATWARRIGANPLATATGRDSDGSLRKDRFWLSASIAF